MVNGTSFTTGPIAWTGASGDGRTMGAEISVYDELAGLGVCRM